MKYFSLGKKSYQKNPAITKNCPARKKNPYPCALEATTYALSKLKGNAVKDQHRNETQPKPRLFQPAKAKRPLPSAAFKLNFPPCFSQGSLRLKI